MSKQSFIYNSDEVNPYVNNPFLVESTSLLRAGGLTETAQIYFATGKCLTCGINDLIWEPMMICGNPVELSPDNNHLVISVPGRYSIGNPNTPVALTGDVNITKEDNIQPWMLPKTCDSAEDCLPLPIRGLQSNW